MDGDSPSELLMSNLNINIVFFAGRLTAKPELKSTQSNHFVTSFRVVCNERFGEKDNATFMDCVAWDKTAEQIVKYFDKGSPIYLSGRLQKRQYEDKTGAKREACEIVIKEFKFVESASEAQKPAAYESSSPSYSSPAYSSDTPMHLEQLSNDDDLPF